jgi:hypothetical protein
VFFTYVLIRKEFLMDGSQSQPVNPNEPAAGGEAQPLGQNLEAAREAVEAKGNALLTGCLWLGFKVGLGLFALGIVGVILWVNLIRSKAPQASVAPEPKPPVVVSAGPDDAAEITRKRAEATRVREREERLAIAKSLQRRAQGLGKEAEQVLGEAEAEMKRWHTEVLALLDNDRGRQIALDPVNVRQADALLFGERPGTDRVQELRDEAQPLIDAVRRMVEDGDDDRHPAEGLLKTLQQVLTDARLIRDAYRGPRGKLERLETAPSGKKAETTLRAAIETMKREDEALDRTAEAKARTTVREGYRTELANAAAELERQKAKRELSALQDKVNEGAAEAEKARVRRLALSPEIRPYIQVFLEKGYTQPRGSEGRYQKEVAFAPVSFSRLKSSGALEKTPHGLEMLCQGAAHSMSGNDRTKWNMPAYTHEWSPADQRFIQRAQDILNELGPGLVELKLLSP